MLLYPRVRASPQQDGDGQSVQRLRALDWQGGRSGARRNLHERDCRDGNTLPLRTIQLAILPPAPANDKGGGNAMITFTPVSEPGGASGGGGSDGVPSLPSASADALAYLAQVDDVRILVGCGSPEEFRFRGDGGLDDQLRAIAPTIDLVLLSHSTMAHVGLYAYARKHFGLTAPCYATLPTATMGRLSIMEAVASLRGEIDFAKGNDEEDGDRSGKLDDAEVAKEHSQGKRADDKHWCVADPADVNDAFEHISTLRYLQPTQLEGKCAGLTLTAYSAGHTLGGALWKLRSPSSGTLLIALDWNHNRERHIDGAALVASSTASASLPTESAGVADAIRRPDLLITSMARATYVNARRKDRDAALLDTIHNTIRSGHSVLMPVDASARLLELLVLLDQHWAFAYPHVRFPLCLVSSSGREMVERARTLMEWMTKEWVRHNMPQAADEDDEAARKRQRSGARGANDRAHAPSSPLDFKYLRIFSSVAAMDEAVSRSDAKVVLAWPPSLTHGPARKLLARSASNERDVVLLTGCGEPGTLGRQLYDEWERQQDQSAKWGAGKVGKMVRGSSRLNIELHDKVPLQGEELEQFMEAKRLASAKAAQQRALLARSTRRVEADDDQASSGSESSDEESEDDGVLEDTQAAEGGEGRTVATKKRSGPGELDIENQDGAPEISFDIYLKGNSSRMGTFFGAPNERAKGRYKTGVRFRTFPVVERKKRIDAYGEMLDISKWLHRRRQLEALGGEEAEAQSLEDQQAAIRSRKAQQAREEEAKRKEEGPPSKFVTEQVSVHLRCSLFFVDMDGLYDGRALKTIVPQLEPRRLIMVESVNEKQRQGTKTAVIHLPGMTQEVYVPAVGDTVEIGESTANYTVNLGEEVMGSLQFSSFQDYQVALLNARINFRAESSIPMLDSLAEYRRRLEAESHKVAERTPSPVPDVPKVKADPDGDEINAPVPDPAPSVGVAQPQTLFIGDLKLSSLKHALARVHKPSLPSEFIGQGTLVCGSGAFRGGTDNHGSSNNDIVTVHKEAQGEIVIEGNVGRNFYQVRDAVYGLHAQVTGQ